MLASKAACRPLLARPIRPHALRSLYRHASTNTDQTADATSGAGSRGGGGETGSGSTQPFARIDPQQRAVRTSMVDKVARATATSSYFLIVAAGVGLVGVVFWALFTNLFFETQYLHHAIDLVKADPTCRELIGEAKEMNFYGQRSAHRGRRGGQVQSIRTDDGRVVMVCHVEGPRGYGTVHLEEIELADGKTELRQLYVDVPGHARIWLKRETPLQKKKKLFSW